MKRFLLATPIVGRRYMSQTSNINKKPFYVTTPIFYVNAAPHLGHLYSMLLCDVRNRWETLNNRESLFTTGTDEHGLKVQAAAEKSKKAPKEFVDQLAVIFKRLASTANIKYDRFIRTTDPDHIVAVNEFWKIANEKGYIYQGEHAGWYSVSDETFYPETQIDERIDEKTGEKQMFSKETNTVVTYQKEINYFFRLSLFYDDLIKILKENDDFIIPRSKQVKLMNELELQGKLEDLSVSRPASRLQWGIPVPGDSNQTIYVWFDALVNYLTSAGFPFKLSASIDASLKETANKFWPATHVIGKDIIKFHGVYWPCFLLAVGLPVPQQLVVHGHWLSQGVKMSKSIGNVVDPIEMIEYYGTDPLRFFLCESSVLDGDGDFTEERLFFTRNNIMAKFANLIMRSCGTKFNVERAVKSYQNRELADINKLFKDYKNGEIITEKYNDLVKKTNLLQDKVGGFYEKFETMKVIESVWDIIIQANQLFQLAEPWGLQNNRKAQDSIIFISLETARISSILLLPIMPTLCMTFLDRFSVSPTSRSIEYTKVGADLTYGAGANRSGDAPMLKLKKRVIK